MKLTKKILTLTILLSCLGGLYGQVYISEIMADNETVLADGAGDYEDWIELRNTSNTSINLGGWYLTDDTNDLTKWTFPTVTIGANSRIVVWASGKYPTSLNNGLHTDFSLESKGEYLALVMPDGNTIANDFTYPALPQFPAVRFTTPPMAIHQQQALLFTTRRFRLVLPLNSMLLLLIPVAVRVLSR